MDVNYLIIGLVVLAALAFIVWLIRRNLKDKKEFEKEIIESDLKPEKHDDDHV